MPELAGRSQLIEDFCIVKHDDFRERHISFRRAFAVSPNRATEVYCQHDFDHQLMVLHSLVELIDRDLQDELQAGKSAVVQLESACDLTTASD